MTSVPINVLFSRDYSKLSSAFNVLPDDRFKVIACPLFDIKPVVKQRQLADDFYQAVTADYLIFTSQYAVIETIEYLKTLGINSSQLKQVKICAVGPIVAQKLAEYGLATDMMPDLYTAESLAELFQPVVKQSVKIFFPKGNRAARKLESVLDERGYSVISPIIYKTELRSDLEQQPATLFQSKHVDCFAFTSPSSVIALTSILGAANTIKILSNTVICAIGTTTHQACMDAGLTVSIMPKEYTIAGLARAIEGFYSTDKCINNN